MAVCSISLTQRSPDGFLLSGGAFFEPEVKLERVTSSTARAFRESCHPSPATALHRSVDARQPRWRDLAGFCFSCVGAMPDNAAQ